MATGAEQVADRVEDGADAYCAGMAAEYYWRDMRCNQRPMRVGQIRGPHLVHMFISGWRRSDFAVSSYSTRARNSRVRSSCGARSI